MRHLLCLAALLLVSSSAHAVPWVFQHDQFDPNLTQAANQVNGGQFYTQPGFVAGEAFGQIYKPLPEMFPLTVTGFDLILAAPPGASGPLYANATIEIYNSTSTLADPGNAPIFSITTADLFNPATQQFGFPLIGNYGISVDFGQGDPQDRPPLITGGNIWLVIRFNDQAVDMSAEWDEQCAIYDFGPDLQFGCGCQNVGTVHDNDITGKANVLHIVQPLGECSGNKAWVFMETLTTGTGFHIDGDVIMRLKADVASGPCVPQCDGKDCGDDGCGGECGDCGDLVCFQNACVTCAPNCASKQCGDDGCGGSCGTCNGSSSCGVDFFCHVACTPSCGTKECGNDGCGGTCGSCSGGETCNGSGQCATPCTPACGGKQCGDNGCGGTCGSCTGGDSCNDSGQCVADCVSDCSDKECGSNGCGGSCGSCPNSEACDAGQCVVACVASCDGKECGDNGCGGSCGSCGSGESCTSGQCEAGTADFAVTDVSPDSTLAMTDTAISITGRGFAAGASVKVGAVDCTNVSVTGTALISATVPGLSIGQYSVIVINPGGEIATLTDGFEVFPKDLVQTKGKSSGCAGAEGGLASLLGLLGLALLRRRSA